MKNLLATGLLLISTTLTLTAGAEPAEKQTLNLGSGLFEYSETSQVSIALTNTTGHGLAVAKCEKEDQSIAYGGCDTHGKAEAMIGSSIHYGAGQGTLQGSYGIFAANGRYTWVCKFKDLKQGDYVIAKVVCK